MNSDMVELRNRIRAFAAVRDWDQFHSPKNLSMALAGEAGELLEVFQWLTEEESKAPDEKTMQRAKEELADVFVYAVRLSDKLGIDLLEAAMAKINMNEVKYPVGLSKGNAKKYTELNGSEES